jgi:hypothetical protein
MAAYNFPNSPSDGDTVTSNGITYTYSSSKTRWDGAAPSGSSTTVYATIDDLPLSGASTGDQAYVSGNNRLYIWNGTGWYNIALINTTPSISGASSAYDLATDGTATTVTITATDPEGIPITYSIASDTSGNVATVTQGTGANSNVFTVTPSTNTANAGTFSLTFRASDGVNIATAVSSFTLQFSVENSNYTTALITSVGANNAVNNSIDDASTNNHTITANGNVTQNTFSPYRHGGYSTYHDGSGDYLTVSNQAAIALGSGDFCVECWTYLNSRDNDRPGIWSNYGVGGFDASALALIAGHGTSTTTQYQVAGNYTGGSSFIINAGTILYKQWVHLAVVRNSGTIYLYVNGVEEGSASVSQNFNKDDMWIGVTGDNTTKGINGYVTDFRVVVGSSVYTSAFTPPTERLTAIANTSLLTCHLPYIADGSTNAHAITVNGNTKTEPFGPYDHGVYSTADNGGSIYFDGSGDYLSSTITGPGTGDFTYEFWYYPTNSSFDGTSFNTRSSGNSGADGFDLNLTSTGIQATYTNVIWLNVSTSAIKAFNWNHIALVRNSGTVTIYVNGTSVGTASQTSNFSSTSFNLFANVLNGTGLSGHVTDFRYATTAVYTSSFTPPTAPLTAITNTSLLLNGTDAGIIDKSQSVKTITLNGDVKSSTTQTKYLTSSMYFDGSGDSLTIGNNQGLHIGSGDFTIEMWFRAAAVNTNQTLIIRRSSATARGFVITINPASGPNKIGFLAGDTSVTPVAWDVSINSTSDLSADTWHHIAIVRSGNNFYLYLDGTQETSASWSGTIADDTSDMHIGVNDAATVYFTGYLSDVRITKGLARYTALDETANIPSAALQG